jgi:hypothetical protein
VVNHYSAQGIEAVSFCPVTGRYAPFFDKFFATIQATNHVKNHEFYEKFG